MITLNDIKNAVIRRLRECKSIDVETITGEDLLQQEGDENFFPMLHIQIHPVASEVKAAGYHAGRTVLVDVSYMEQQHTSNAELYDMLDKLDAALFPVLHVADRYLLLQNIRPNITDDIAHYIFTLSFDDPVPFEDDPVPAQELIMRLKI